MKKLNNKDVLVKAFEKRLLEQYKIGKSWKIDQLCKGSKRAGFKITKSKIENLIITESLKKNKVKNVYQYFVKIGANIQAGVGMYTHENADGTSTDYYGFPSSMSLTDRRKRISSSYLNDDLSEILTGNKKANKQYSYQTWKRIYKSTNRKKQWSVIKDEFSKIRKKNKKIPAENWYEEIDRLIRAGKLPNPSLTGYPSIASIKRNVNSKS